MVTLNDDIQVIELTKNDFAPRIVLRGANSHNVPVNDDVKMLRENALRSKLYANDISGQLNKIFDGQARVRQYPENPKSQKIGSVGCHWFRGTTDRKKVDEVLDFLKIIFGEPQQQEFGRFCYDSRFYWPQEVSLYYCSNSEKADRLLGGKICLDVCGSALDRFDAEMLEIFLIGVKSLDFRAARFDVFYDDIERIITPSEMLELVADFAKKGEKPFSKFKIHEPRQSYKNCVLTHDEVIFGRRGNLGSGAYLRVYDKALESCGENNAIRWELELSDEKADKAFQFIAGLPGKQQAVAYAALVGGSIEFYQRRKNEKNLDRLHRLNFWQKLIERMGKAEIRVCRENITMERKKAFIDKQCGATLSMLRKVAETPETFYQWIIDLCDDDGILKKRHKTMIEDFKRSRATGDMFSVRDLKDYLLSRNIECSILGSEKIQ